MGVNLFKKYGSRLSRDYFDGVLKDVESERPIGRLMPAHKGSLVTTACFSALAAYCSDDKEAAKELAKKCVAYSSEFFFGSWRNEVLTDNGNLDPEWWRKNLRWVDQFRFAMCWAASLNMYSEAERLALYPREDSCARTELDEICAAFFSLACILRGEPADAFAVQLSKGLGSTNEKARHLADGLNALAHKDDLAFQTAMDKYIAFYRTSEFDSNTITKIVSLDATILLHAGLNAGLRYELSDATRDYVIRFAN